MGWIRSIFAALGLANDRAPVAFEANDTALAEAARKAQATFAEFSERLSNPREDDASFLVKIRLSDGEKRFESVWCEDPEFEDGAWQATIANRPRMSGYGAGQRLSFSAAEIADWCFWEDGRMRGGFSYAAMLATLPPKEQARMRQQLGIEEVP